MPRRFVHRYGVPQEFPLPRSDHSTFIFIDFKLERLQQIFCHGGFYPFSRPLRVYIQIATIRITAERTAPPFQLFIQIVQVDLPGEYAITFPLMPATFTSMLSG